MDGITLTNGNKTGLGSLIIFFCLGWFFMYLDPAHVLFWFLTKGQVNPVCAASADEFCSRFNLFLVPIYALNLKHRSEAVWFFFSYLTLFASQWMLFSAVYVSIVFLKLICHSYSMQEHFGIIVLTHIRVSFSWSFWLLLPWGLYTELSILIWFVSPENRLSFQMSEVKI